jgi:hypothetical protein
MGITSNVGTTSSNIANSYTTATGGSYTINSYPYSNWVESNVPTYDEISQIKRRLDKIEKGKGEKPKMFENLTKNLKCGLAQNVRISMYGLAFKNEDNTWYTVDSNGVFTEVTNFLVDDDDSFCYMMPVAKKDIKENDFILYDNQWIMVRHIAEDGAVEGINTANRLLIHLMPTKSPFGFEFYTKLMPLFDFKQLVGTEENPFGSLPMMLMLKEKNDDLLPLLLMQNGGFDMSNPMLMYFLMKDKK